MLRFFAAGAGVADDVGDVGIAMLGSESWSKPTRSSVALSFLSLMCFCGRFFPQPYQGQTLNSSAENKSPAARVGLS
jgi:hypothetical protein